MATLDPATLAPLYRWVDTIPLDRPKKNIARDFSDGVLMSQVIHYFFPRLVELHNYSASNSVDQKNYNWKTLNNKVFKKMGFMLSPTDIEAVVTCKKHAIERVLLLMQAKIAEYQRTQGGHGTGTAPDALDAHVSSTAAVAAVPATVSPTNQTMGRKANQSQYASSAAAPVPTRHRSIDHTHSSSSSRSSDPSSASHGHGHGHGPASSASSMPSASASVSSPSVRDLQETVDILQLKVSKLEQLLQLKNSKIASLQARIEQLEGKGTR